VLAAISRAAQFTFLEIVASMVLSRKTPTKPEVAMKKLDSLREKFNSFCDFLWVSRAFLRGKLLHQKAYRPQGNFLRLFRLPVPVTKKRIVMLMRWWGCRLPTLDEANALVEWAVKQNDNSSRTPFLNWTGNGWEKNGGGDWGDTRHCIFATHRY